MRVLVVGRTGQLARALGESAEADWHFAGREEADLVRPGAAAQAVRRHAPAAVINAAAYTAVDGAESDEATAMRVNADAVGEIAGAAAAIGAMLVHVSTDYVFDGSGARAWREDDPAAPLGAYGRSKLAGERAALAANPRTVILRTAWLYAPWGRNFVRTMLRLAAERSALRVIDDQRGNPTSALDLARACRRVVEVMHCAPPADPRWGVYHYAGDGAVTWAGFAREIFALAAERRLIESVPQVEPITSADYPTPARRPVNSTLDCARFERAFGLAPRPWRAALAETLDLIGAEVTE